MVISTKSIVLVAGRPVRVLSSRFNCALRSGKLDPKTPEGKTIVPSSGKTWLQVASLLRAGKSVQAKVAA
jgi:hypothetical protein